MSSNDDQGGPGQREVAYRLFAAEFDDADFSYSESDEERAPNYVVTPTGARVNRIFLAGVLTEVETVSEDYLRARIVDLSGPFVVYAGQYQPEALAFLESADPPTFVAVTGKARTYQPDDSDQVYTSVRPESINEVDEASRDRWVVQTADQTLDRVARAAEAKQSDLTGDDLRAALEAHGVDEGLAAGIPLALEHYGTTGAYLSAVRGLALDAARVVAGERDEVESLTTRPGQGDDGPLASLVETPIDVDTEVRADEEPETADSEPATTTTATDADSRPGTAEPSTETSTDTTEPTESETPTESAVDAGDATESEELTTAVAETGTTESESADADGTDAHSVESPDTESIDEATTASSTSVETTTASPTSDDGGAAEPETGDAESDDLGDFDPEFELDEDEREEIESEYGTEFQSGTEVDEPGEADIETPDPDEIEEGAEAERETTAATAPTGDAGTVTESDDDAPVDVDGTEADESSDTDESASDAEPAEDVDLEDAVMDAMGDLDDGDGAERTAIVETVADRTGSDSGRVEDAIQDALMGGRCYEPEDGHLKPI